VGLENNSDCVVTDRVGEFLSFHLVSQEAKTPMTVTRRGIGAGNGDNSLLNLWRKFHWLSGTRFIVQSLFQTFFEISLADVLNCADAYADFPGNRGNSLTVSKA
jgi:hypothetical protein